MMMIRGGCMGFPQTMGPVDVVVVIVVVVVVAVEAARVFGVGSSPCPCDQYVCKQICYR